MCPGGNPPYSSGLPGHVMRVEKDTGNEQHQDGLQSQAQEGGIDAENRNTWEVHRVNRQSAGFVKGGNPLANEDYCQQGQQNRGGAEKQPEWETDTAPADQPPEHHERY